MKLKCRLCHWEKEEIGTESHLDPEIYVCFICGGQMEDVEEVETDNINLGIDKSLILSIEQEINIMGNDFVWGTLEQIADPIMRLRYRSHFFKAGGIVPLKEMEIK